MNFTVNISCSITCQNQFNFCDGSLDTYGTVERSPYSYVFVQVRSDETSIAQLSVLRQIDQHSGQYACIQTMQPVVHFPVFPKKISMWPQFIKGSKQRQKNVSITNSKSRFLKFCVLQHTSQLKTTSSTTRTPRTIP